MGRRPPCQSGVGGRKCNAAATGGRACALFGVLTSAAMTVSASERAVRQGNAPMTDEAMTTLSERETLELYEKTGALMRGHFRLTSGLHSDIYLQSALVLQYPEHAARLGEALAAPYTDARAQTVLAPAIGGILVAHEVARDLVGDQDAADGREVVECVRASGGSVIGVGTLIDRSGGTAAFDVKRASLATVSASTWPPEACPLCKGGGHAIKPGSRV